MHPSTNVTYPLPRAQAPDDSGHRRECSWQSCSHSWRRTRQSPPSRHTARHRASSHSSHLQHSITVTSHGSSPREFTQSSATTQHHSDVTRCVALASSRPTLTYTWSQHGFTSIFSNKTTPNECDVIFMLTINNSNTFLFLRSESEL